MVRIARPTEPPHIWQWRGRDRNRETIRRQLGSPDASFGLDRGIDRERVHPAFEHDGIEVNELRDPFGNPIGDPGDRDTPKAVSHKDYVGKFLGFDDPNQVFDKRVDRDLPTEEMRPVAHAREAGGVDLAAGIAQSLSDALPAPTAPPRTMRQHERSQPAPPLAFL
jgi:hypothetical protein